ncbi:MAG: 6-phosphogluconolactonase [Minisyncoccia bacterium]
MKIHTLPGDKVIEGAAQALNEAFAKQAGKEFLFLSCGGSSLAILDHLDSNNFGPRSTVSVLDERYTTDPANNTFALITQTDFYKKISANGAHFIDTRVEDGESIEGLAKRFEDGLRDWRGRTHGAVIAMVGIGPDGHTGGMMPHPDEVEFFNTTFNDDAHWVASYDAKDRNPFRLRVTTTLPFMRTIDTAIIYMVGENKRRSLERLLADEGGLAETPCRVWKDVAGAELFTDLTP